MANPTVRPQQPLATSGKRRSAAARTRCEVDVVHSSGTTDERVELLWNQAWWDASERASWLLNRHAREAGLDHHPEAILTSPLSTGVHGHGAALDMASRRLDRFLYLNEFADSRDWTDDHVRRMWDELCLMSVASGVGMPQADDDEVAVLALVLRRRVALERATPAVRAEVRRLCAYLLEHLGPLDDGAHGAEDEGTDVESGVYAATGSLGV